MSLLRLSDTLQYKLITLAEETLEMFGIVLFLQALLGYLASPESTPRTPRSS